MLKNMYDVFFDEKHEIFQVRCGDDVVKIQFPDAEKQQIFTEIIALIKEYGNLNSLLSDLCKKYDKAKVYSIVEELENLDLIEEDDLHELFKTNYLKEQINFWSYGKKKDTPKASKTQLKIEEAKLLLVGNDLMLDRLSDKAELSGFKNVIKQNVKDLNKESDLDVLLSSCDFVIVDASNWNPYWLEIINQTAVSLNKPWILIRGVNGTNASIGPLFVGKETGCYHCLMERLKSNMDFLPYFDEFENYLKKQEQSSKGSCGPIMLFDIIASIGVLEAVKYITEWTIPILYKSFINIDLYTFDITHHPILKVPACPICRPNLDFMPAPWLESVTLR